MIQVDNGICSVKEVFSLGKATEVPLKQFSSPLLTLKPRLSNPA